MRYTHYDEFKKRWQINDDYGAIMIDELNYAIGEAIDKLAAYENAEEQGRLLILPKKLYGFYEWDVTGVRYNDGKVTAYYVKDERMESIIYECEIGDSVFFTREEAEAAWNRRAE